MSCIQHITKIAYNASSKPAQPPGDAFNDPQSLLLLTPDIRCARQPFIVESCGRLVSVDQCANNGHIWCR